MNINNPNKLFIIKTIHTIIYLIMVISIFYIVYAGITKIYNIWLYIALALISIESIVYIGNRMTCPLTTLAKKYGDPTKGYVGDTFFPESFTDLTFKIFGSILFLGLLILVINVLI